MNYPTESALLTDLYELTMLHVYYKEGMTGHAVFELFLHKRPDNRNFLIAAGLDQALDYLENFAFTEDECQWLDDSGRFDKDFIDILKDFTFTGAAPTVPKRSWNSCCWPTRNSNTGHATCDRVSKELRSRRMLSN